MAADKEQTGNPLWDSWLSTLRAAASPISTYASLIDQVRAASGAAAPNESGPATTHQQTTAPADLLQAFFGGQQAVLRMMQLAAETMRSMSVPETASAGDLEASFKRSLEEFRTALTTHPMLGGQDLWTAGVAQYGRFAEPWTELMQRSMGIASAMGSPSGSGDPLGEALERSFGVIADFPGINAELPALLREGAANTLALVSARETYRAIMAATWQRAFEAITSEVLRRSADGKPVDSAAALLSLSTGVADRVFVETFNSDRYIEAQRRLSMALADQRELEMKIVDLFARSGHFPTRRDHADVLREISVLRRELRTLKRGMRAAPAQPQQPAPGAQPSPNGAAVAGSRKRRVNVKPAVKGKKMPKKTDPGKNMDRGK